MRRQALRIALSEKIKAGNVAVLDSLDMKSPRSSVIRDIVTAFELNGRTLIVTDSVDHNVIKSASNLQGVEIQTAALMNPLEAASYSNLIVTQDAVTVIDRLWGRVGSEQS
jgi:large subunit ribosomal protein L4